MLRKMNDYSIYTVISYVWTIGETQKLNPNFKIVEAFENSRLADCFDMILSVCVRY